MKFIIGESDIHVAQVKWLLERAAQLQQESEQNASELREITRQIERLQETLPQPSRPSAASDR